MMQGGGQGEEEEEAPDPAVLDFMARHSQALLQRPYMLTEEQFALINEHIATTINHIDVSLSLAFPFNQQVLYPSIQNPQVLHIPNSPLSGKPYVEALPSTTRTNSDFSEPNPICITTPISTYMHQYLSRYPYSTTILSWFDNLCTSLSMLQPYFTHLNALSPYVALQFPNTLDKETGKHDITGHHESIHVMNTVTTPQLTTAISAKASLIALPELSQEAKIEIMKTNLPTVSGSITNVMTHAILYGSNKTGKTTTACYLAHILSQHPSINAHIVYIDCAPYKEASVQIINVVFQHVFATSRLKHSPTVLLLDNLDIIAHPHKDHEDNSVSEAIIELLINHHHQQLQDRCMYPTFILATAKHADALHPRIVSQLFPSYSCNIESPTYSQRQFVILEQLNSFATAFSSRTTKQSANDRSQRQLDLDVLQTIINNTEGYTFPDITLLVHKIVNFMTVEQHKKLSAHIAMLRQSRTQSLPLIKDNTANVDGTTEGEKDNKQEPPRSRWGLRDITSELITKLTSTYIPLSLRGIGLSKPPNLTDQKKWYDVGALSKVIQTLRQTFEYPVLYPQLFNNSPLKLISGALIYGAPGSGKSILATALQFSCPKLHFIRVKGPEVLDKYVGASEDNVRKIFASARAAKPCVIFFDDFDSIALKRGSDSNGVTDRVVNQLLVEMDGVKGREGVFILAATTHPELIDSALLRPGRLDLQLYCPLPETNLDRESVLRSISGCNADYRPKDDKTKQPQDIMDDDIKDTDEEKPPEGSDKSVDNDTKTEAVKQTKKKKEVQTIQPPVQGAADYIYNTASNVKKQYQAVLDQHNLTQGHDHTLDTPQGRALAIRKYKHRFPYVLADDVDFVKVSKLLKNFTGADINALLTNALLYIQSNDDDDDVEEDDDEAGKESEVKPTEPKTVEPKCQFLFHLPILTTELLIQGYNMTPISLPEADRKKFTEAFKKFIQDKDQPEAMQKFDPNSKGKVAMAQ
jgi:SpoVK/Ycf46/Vps4 family AAA+-type ATPase